MPMPWDAARQKQIGRTRTGILILLIGALVSPIPYVGAVGVLFTFIGAIMVILGRKAFGPAHQRNVMISIVLFCLGVAIFISGLFFAVGAIIRLSPSTPEAQLAAIILSTMTNLLIVISIGLLVLSAASLFFTYALQKREGRLVLSVAYAATVAITIAALVLALPGLPALAADVAHQFALGGPLDPTVGLNTTPIVGFLNVIPSLLYGAANYLVWTRIKKGEIPAPSMAPGMAPAPVAPIQPR